MSNTYTVRKANGPVEINAGWDKTFWAQAESAEIALPHWPSQTDHLPKTEVKLLYDEDNLYVIFHVEDRFVAARATEINGDVWKDSCVEFYFSPTSQESTAYSNIEVNCCGVMLMECHDGPREGTRFVEPDLCRKIEIGSSLSGPIEEEIAKPVTWTVEYRLPLSILNDYFEVEKPAPGVSWRGNFYKCADKSSHPHWMAWSPVGGSSPDFHRPDFFGTLVFE